LLLRSATEIGVIKGETSLPRLFFARAEAEAILQGIPIGQRLKALDFKASRATATSQELYNYRIVHFATHGLLNSEHPELSGLVLSLVDEQGKEQNGFLGLEDIYRLNLRADLVVLSACETGLGKEIQGEGLVGIARGFMYAGASSVVASLWKVDDLATAEFMKVFYQGMLKDKLRPGAALRRAQIAMSKRRTSPYFWAGFVLQGQP
jgi:CHAT domain-containing protein